MRIGEEVKIINLHSAISPWSVEFRGMLASVTATVK
jgi:hypothetical protein